MWDHEPNKIFMNHHIKLFEIPYIETTLGLDEI